LINAVLLTYRTPAVTLAAEFVIVRDQLTVYVPGRSVINPLAACVAPIVLATITGLVAGTSKIPNVVVAGAVSPARLLVMSM
jgi:hypothetical protein